MGLPGSYLLCFTGRAGGSRRQGTQCVLLRYVTLTSAGSSHPPGPDQSPSLSLTSFWTPAYYSTLWSECGFCTWIHMRFGWHDSCLQKIFFQKLTSRHFVSLILVHIQVFLSGVKYRLFVGKRRKWVFGWAGLRIQPRAMVKALVVTAPEPLTVTSWHHFSKCM